MHISGAVLSGCWTTRDNAAQFLLVECEALGVVDIQWSNHQHELCIDLENVIEFSWIYNIMRRLELTIGVPGELSQLHTGVKPY